MAKQENMSFQTFGNASVTRTHAESICSFFAGLTGSYALNAVVSVTTPSVDATNISAHSADIKRQSCQDLSCLRASFLCRIGFGPYILFLGISAATRPLSLPQNWELLTVRHGYLLHRIRSAMAERDAGYILSGIVEMDDTYIGAPTEGCKRGRGTEKAKVMVAVSKTDEGKPCFLKMKVVDDLKGETVGEFAKENVLKGSLVQSDAYRSYRKPLSDDFDHQFKVYDSHSDMLKWLHTLVGNFKAFINGTFHGLDDKHLHSYLDEFCYRFNRRGF